MKYAMKFVVSAFLLMAMPLHFALAKDSASCSGVVSRTWIANLRIEALASGPSCKDAVAVLTIRKASGQVLWTRAHAARELLNFTQDPITDSKSMTVKLKEWMSGDGFMNSADKLTESGEFPFTRAEGVNQTMFKKYQASKLPVFCYVQGMESGNCLIVDKGTVVELGIQSFPG